MLIRNDTRGYIPDPSVMTPKRFRNMGVIVPNIVRPALLTDRLRGCDCPGCLSGVHVGVTAGVRGVHAGNVMVPTFTMQGGGRYFGMEGMGQIDPASLTLELNTLVASAREFWDSLQRTLGIGAGRREADVITPMQDKITATILAPAVQLAQAPQSTCLDLRKMLGVVQQARVEFKSFLTNTQWQDGRAAQQALVWLEGPLPASSTGAWFHQVESDFTGDVARRCGSSGGGAIPPGGQVTGSSALPLSVILGAAFLLLPKLRLG